MTLLEVAGPTLTVYLPPGWEVGRRTLTNKKPDPSLEGSGYKPGNNLLSRDLSSYYHWLLGA